MKLFGLPFIFVFLMTPLLSVIAQEQQPHVAYGPAAIDKVDAKDRDALDRSLANFLYAINTNSFDSCYSVDFDYLQAEWNPFLFLDNAQKSGKHKDPWFYKPVVTYAAPLEKDAYTVKIAFMGIDPDNGDPILRMVYSLVGKKTGDNFQFFSLLETIKSQWNKRKIGNILFYYRDVLDEGIASGFAEFNSELALKIGTDEIEVSYFKGRDGRELFYLLGCDYINNAYFANTGGLADPSRNYIFAGNNSEAYPHELVHLYMAKKFEGPRNHIAEEGYCTYLGGSGEQSMEQLLARLKKYLAENTDADTLELFMDDFQLDGDYSTMYIVSGLLMKTIENQHGMDGVAKAIKAENQPAAYFGVLEELLGINEGNFTDKVNALLDAAA